MKKILIFLLLLQTASSLFAQESLFFKQIIKGNDWNGISVSPDGRFIVCKNSEYSGGFVKTYDLTGNNLSTIYIPSPKSVAICSTKDIIAISQDSYRYKVHDERRNISIYNFKTGSLVKAFELPDQWSPNLRFTPDGNYLICGGGCQPGMQSMRDCNSWQEIKTLNFKGDNFNFYSDATLVSFNTNLSDLSENSVDFWNINSNTKLKTIVTQIYSPIPCISFDNKLLISGINGAQSDKTMKINITDIASGSITKTIEFAKPSSNSEIKSLSISPDNKIICCLVGEIGYFINIETGKQIAFTKTRTEALFFTKKGDILIQPWGAVEILAYSELEALLKKTVNSPIQIYTASEIEEYRKNQQAEIDNKNKIDKLFNDTKLSYKTADWQFALYECPKERTIITFYYRFNFVVRPISDRAKKACNNKLFRIKFTPLAKDCEIIGANTVTMPDDIQGEFNESISIFYNDNYDPFGIKLSDISDKYSFSFYKERPTNHGIFNMYRNNGEGDILNKRYNQYSRWYKIPQENHIWYYLDAICDFYLLNPIKTDFSVLHTRDCLRYKNGWYLDKTFKSSTDKTGFTSWRAAY